MKLLPFLFVGVLLAFLSACENEDNGNGDGDEKTLDVTVNFTGDVTPEPGDVLMVVVFNTDVTQMDLTGDIEPDVIAPVLLTQADIDAGVTVNLDTIDLDQPEMYIGAFVDLDGDEEPGLGDLIEFYQDLSFVDALYYGDAPVNANGLSTVEIDLDIVLEMPTLDVTVNFPGNTVPEAGDGLFVALFYSTLEGADMETLTPDDEIDYTLEADDITNGVTLTFTDINPVESEAYIGIFADLDGNGEPGPGELIECYEDKNIFEVIAGTADADDVLGLREITVDLDIIIPEPLR